MYCTSGVCFGKEKQKRNSTLEFWNKVFKNEIHNIEDTNFKVRNFRLRQCSTSELSYLNNKWSVEPNTNIHGCSFRYTSWQVPWVSHLLYSPGSRALRPLRISDSILKKVPVGKIKIVSHVWWYFSRFILEMSMIRAWTLKEGNTVLWYHSDKTFLSVNNWQRWQYFGRRNQHFWLPWQELQPPTKKEHWVINK